MISDLLSQKNINISYQTTHKYMKELGLKSIILRKRPAYLRGSKHKVFPNILDRKFTAEKPNEIWLTNFTYLKLSNGTKNYNCTILDLYYRSVVATLNGNKITAELAINALKLALKNNKNHNSEIMLHRDQGTQFASKEFIDFCKENKIIQSMSKAGCPYDNAPMERFFSSFKNEFYYLYIFRNDEDLNLGINNYVYGWYSHPTSLQQ